MIQICEPSVLENFLGRPAWVFVRNLLEIPLFCFPLDQWSINSWESLQLRTELKHININK